MVLKEMLLFQFFFKIGSYHTLGRSSLLGD